MEKFKKNKEEKEKNLAITKCKFAGEEFIYQKELTEKELKLKEQQEKTKTHRALDELVEKITKKNNINIFDKTKVDWGNYVEKNGLTKDLEYSRKDGYLAKKRFIEQVDFNLIQQRKEEEKKSKYLQSLKEKEKKII